MLKIVIFFIKKGFYLVNEKFLIRKRIKEKELQIKKLNLHQTNSDVCNSLYNSLILEKAILKKELEELGKNPIIETVKKIIPRKEKLICDYFKEA